MLLAACGSSAGGEVLDCNNPIDLLEAPIDGYLATAGVVAFPEPSNNLQVTVDAETGTASSKVGLVVRAGAEFTLRATEDSTLMVWGNTGAGAPSSEMLIPSCEPPSWSDAEWLVYPGGVTVAEPSCVQIAVEVGSRTEIAQLALGADCPSA